MNSLHLTSLTCKFNVLSAGRTGKRGKTESIYKEIYCLLVRRAPKMAIIRMFCFRAEGSIGHSLLKRRGRLCEHSVDHFLRNVFSLIRWGPGKNSFKKVEELERSVSIDFRREVRETLNSASVLLSWDKVDEAINDVNCCFRNSFQTVWVNCCSVPQEHMGNRCLALDSRTFNWFTT
jgi:hypothetical protein